MRGVAVLGAGSWGTALAVHLGRAGHDVRLWARDAALAARIARDRANPRYLQEAALPDSVQPTASLREAVTGASFVLFVVPSHGMRTVVREAAPYLEADAILVSAAKGIETDTLNRMSEVIGQEAGASPVVVLSGPSFAAEVARGLPTAVLAASTDAAAAPPSRSSSATAAFGSMSATTLPASRLAGR
jgi:glycerol-3-phosphate dehydrogenase (NAD(P)+)